MADPVELAALQEMLAPDVSGQDYALVWDRSAGAARKVQLRSMSGLFGSVVWLSSPDGVNVSTSSDLVVLDNELNVVQGDWVWFNFIATGSRNGQVQLLRHGIDYTFTTKYSFPQAVPTHAGVLQVRRRPAQSGGGIITSNTGVRGRLWAFKLGF